MGKICQGILKSISNLNSNQDYGMMEAEATQEELKVLKLKFQTFFIKIQIFIPLLTEGWLRKMNKKDLKVESFAKRIFTLWFTLCEGFKKYFNVFPFFPLITHRKKI